MSDKKQWKADAAMAVADEIIARLAPCCERLAVAGSLRRGKSTVGDIEILFVPRMSEQPDGLFEKKIVSVADEVIECLLKEQFFIKRPNVRGFYSWGESNKLAIHCPSGIPVDLFGTRNENWWVALVVRTGSKENNLLLTTGANKLNRTLNAYGRGVTDRKTGDVIPATSEQHVFELCGVPYKEPKDR